MENQTVGQQFKVISLWIAGLLLAVFVGWKIGSANYTSLAIGTIAIGLACITLLSSRLFWVIAIASSFLAGTFPVLGGSFTPFQILMGVGVAKFVIEEIVLRRTRIKIPARFDLLMIMGFMSVLTLHALHDRFGMRFLGSTVWGGRNYINVYVGLAAFFIIQSIPISSKLWAKLPYFVLAAAGFDFMIAAVTTIFPASIYKIYPFYSAVSRAGIAEIVTGSNVETTRVTAFGGIGQVIITLVLASTPIPELLRPSNFFRLISAVAGSVAALYSSFRSIVLNTVVITLVAGIRDLRFATLLLLPFVGALLFSISFINSEVVHLPKEFQRSLTFIPGKWDADVTLDAAGSNEFRREVWTLWWREFFPAHPWLGRGFGFRSDWAQPSVYISDPEANRRSVEIGQVHNGFFAALDTFGIVGTIFFVAWNLRLLARALTVPFRKSDPTGLPLRFLALYLATLIITYWIGAADVGSFLLTEFAIAGVLISLERLSDSEPVARLIPASEWEGRRELTAA